MKIALLLLLMSITIGCKEIGTSEDGQFQIVEDIPIDQKVTFRDVFNNVISTNRCMQCHSNWASDEQQVLQRIKAGDPDGSRFFARMKDGSMPLGGPTVSTASLEVVERYINDLVISEVEEDDTPPVIITPPDQKVTFNDIFNKVIGTNRCLQCHSSWASDEEQVLQRIKPGDPGASSFFIRMENGSMPLGGPVVSDESLEIVKRYIEGLLKQ